MAASSILGGIPIVRPQFHGQLAERTTADGKHVLVQSMGGNSSQGRLPTGVAVFVDGRIVVTTNVRFIRHGSARRPVSATVTLFDEFGKVSVVTHHDFSETDMTTAIPGMFAYAEGFAPSMITENEVPIDIPPDDACLGQRIALAASVASQVLAIGAVAAAYTACVTTGLPCPSIALALSALAIATAMVVSRNEALLQCLSAHIPPSGPPSSGGGGLDCYDVDWVISYDGGLTWYYHATTTHCEPT